ncbi:unnamed protein product [Lota lota]
MIERKEKAEQCGGGGAGNEIVGVKKDDVLHISDLRAWPIKGPGVSPGPWSYTESKTLKNEEERKGTFVQSEMQMATEDMSNSQSGTRKRKVPPASIYKTNQM